MKDIIAEGYGGLDRDLVIDEKPLYIDESNMDIISNVLLNGNLYDMPIVYVTRSFSDNEPKLDVDELARDLAGAAHVLVESDSRISNMLREKVDNKNPYNGAVQIFYKGKSSYLLLKYDEATANSFRYAVVSKACRWLTLFRPEKALSWDKLQILQMKEVLSNQAGKNKLDEELNKLYEEENNNLESRIKELKDELYELNQSLRTEQIKTDALQQSLKKKQNSDDEGNKIVLNCSERNFYDEELKNAAFDAIAYFCKNMKEDPNTKERRIFHICKNILDNNKRGLEGDKLSKKIRTCLYDYNGLTSKNKRELIQYGFVICDEGKHIKLKFHDDDRYMITLANTPSDGRAAKNLVAEVIKKIF